MLERACGGIAPKEGQQQVNDPGLLCTNVGNFFSKNFKYVEPAARTHLSKEDGPPRLAPSDGMQAPQHRQRRTQVSRRLERRPVQALELGWDGIGWDGMGWDGMGWDGMRWDRMGWDGMG